MVRHKFRGFFCWKSNRAEALVGGLTSHVPQGERSDEEDEEGGCSGDGHPARVTWALGALHTEVSEKPSIRAGEEEDLRRSPGLAYNACTRHSGSRA